MPSDHEPRQKKINYEPTITLGNLIVMLPLVALVAGDYVYQGARLDHEQDLRARLELATAQQIAEVRRTDEERAVQIEKHVADEEKRVEGRWEEISKTMNRIDDKLMALMMRGTPDQIGKH